MHAAMAAHWRDNGIASVIESTRAFFRLAVDHFAGDHEKPRLA
jgi:hypothetical protein